MKKHLLVDGCGCDCDVEVETVVGTFEADSELVGCGSTEGSCDGAVGGTVDDCTVLA